MSDLPLVLAGPIVRRVDARSCSLWIALRDEATVSAHVWTGTQVATDTPGTVASGDSPLANVDVATKRFGPKLHIALATVTFANPAPPLTPGAIHSYDLTFIGTFGSSGLRLEGLLRDETSSNRIAGVDASAPMHRALGYITDRLPSFVTPAGTIAELRLAQASCRKATGPGFDAMAWLDDEIEAHVDDASARPHQLFLTGDQIYADEMSAAVLHMLNDVGGDVIGEETLAVRSGTNVAATLTNFPAMRRQRLVREVAQFTSTSAHNHLLSYREYACMYLAAWSSRVWRPLASNGDILIDVPSGAHSATAAHLTDWEACGAEETPPKSFSELHTGTLDTRRERVELYRAAVPRVARLLANCATYMIFDDHEVTDDWNLNKKWQNRVYSNPLGLHIVRNAMMAYTAFQAWGNDPQAFTKGKNKELLDKTVAAFAGSGPFAGGSDVAALDNLVGSNPTAAGAATFNYKVEGPRHTVVVLDTRTKRGFKGQGYHPPKLLGSSLNKQVPKGPLTDGREVLLVISAAPVLGPHLIDRLGAPLAQIVWDSKNSVQDLFGDVSPCSAGPRSAGAEHFDAESWAADEDGFEKLLARLAPYRRAVILSGDVHYGCTLTVDYWRKGQSEPDRIVQLTSSPARNEFKPVIEAILRSTAQLQRYQAGPAPERLAWKAKSPIELPDDGAIGPGRRARMNRAPSLVPARVWPAGTTIPSDKPPDWRWRLSMVRDERPESTRPAALRQQPLSAELQPSDALASYRAIAARHSQAALTHFDHLRQMVFTQNVGLVSFTEAAGEISLRHTLLSKDAPDSQTCAQNTVHEVSLAPTNEAQPELVTRG